ncbi:MAG: RagB/SusD family nutrient uptake outer membrane protein [Bacteroidales bacterium]
MKKLLLILSIGMMLFAACEMDYDPTDQITPEKLIEMPGGLASITNGNYAMLKDVLTFNGQENLNYSYLRQYFFLTEFASDNVVCGQVTTDPFFLSFSRQHTPSQENTAYFWYVSYKIISATNLVINRYERGEIQNPSASDLQMIGESYFMRAFAHFTIVNLFAKPYTLDPQSPGIIIRNSDNEKNEKARATVAEVYDFVLNDLRKAAALMKPSTYRGPGYPSVFAADALMSRVFLYMNENDSVIKYASRVIESGKFEIESDFPNYFANAPSSKETIWCIIHTIADDKKKFGSIASMYYSDGNSGWGEEYASDNLRMLMEQNPEDTRNQYIVPLLDNNGNVMRKAGTGIKIYYVTRFSFQDGSPTLSSPVMLRISEMYLNRAEAFAKKGNVNEALADINAIRERRGLQNKLYTSVPSGKSLLDIVLEERRIELAFEGHRTFDLFRNKRNLVRDYWGYHLIGLKESDVDYSKPAPVEIIPYDDPRNIYYIPENEIRLNPLCSQNP